MIPKKMQINRELDFLIVYTFMDAQNTVQPAAASCANSAWFCPSALWGVFVSKNYIKNDDHIQKFS